MDERDCIPPDVLRRANQVLEDLQQKWGMRLLHGDDDTNLWSECNDVPDEDGRWYDHFYERLVLTHGGNREERLGDIVQYVQRVMPELSPHALKEENRDYFGDLVIIISVPR